MRALLPRALDLLSGRVVGPIRTKDELSKLGSVGSPPLFSLSPSRKLTKSVRDKGYTHIRRFVAIPSHSTARWLLPIGCASGAIAGTQIYRPYKWAPRMIKSLLIAMMKMGWDGWLGSQVLVASRGLLPLEALVCAVTGEHRPLLALSLGRQAAVRKLTVQVMRSSGDILGYMKLPLTDAATERVRNEAIVLERLWKFPALRPHIPRLLYAGNWNETYVLFQSALEGERGPVSFNGMHEKFLETLRSVHWVEIPGKTLIAQLAAKWQKAVPHLGAAWEDLGQEVLRLSTRNLEGKVLRCSVMHGDFAPWNTRVVQNKLLSFDWESADWEAPVSWDIFHFHLQTASSLRKSDRFLRPPRSEPYDEISFMLYVLSSVCQFLGEDNHTAISLRQRLLTDQLHNKDVLLETPASAA
jgi:hypothetical protein